jgi:5-methylcytosine-specific restriction endonuclease McrA
MVPIKNSYKDQNYNELLQDPRWATKRTIILKRDQFQCRHCGSEEKLQVHHRQYHFMERTQEFQLPWNYSNQYLVTLCKSCHENGHLHYKVPTFNI